MNDYGFDYLNYIMNVPNGMNTNLPNNMNFIQNSSMNMMKKPQVLEPYQAFIRGNSFQNEYVPYKNYKPMELNPKNERDALLYQLLQYKFILTDLNLYLDTHPKEQEMIELYNKYLKIEKQICDKYESMYGPLTVDTENMKSNMWVWNKSPWPWEVM